MTTFNFKTLLPYYKERPSSSYKYKFTVFTPVFNCEDSIVKVYESLVNQSFKDFEWLVINDASTDNSHKVITELIKNSPLDIHYVNNEHNKHKMSCFVQSIELAKGEFLLPFDGDDECVPTALEVFNNEYENIEPELKPKVAAITVCCKDQHGHKIGKEFPESPFYCNTFEARLKNQIVGEKWGFTKTDVLRYIHVNPQMLDIGFVPESIIWDIVAKHYLTKCVNSYLRIYHVGVQGSIMNTPMNSKNAKGTVLNGIAQINTFFGQYFMSSPVFFLKIFYVTIRSSKFLDAPFSAYLKAFNPILIKALTLVIWPFRKLLR